MHAINCMKGSADPAWHLWLQAELLMASQRRGEGALTGALREHAIKLQVQMYQVLLPVSGIPDKPVTLTRLTLQCRTPVCTRLGALIWRVSRVPASRADCFEPRIQGADDEGACSGCSVGWARGRLCRC